MEFWDKKAVILKKKTEILKSRGFKKRRGFWKDGVLKFKNCKTYIS